MTTHDLNHDAQLTAYALGELEGDEAAAVEQRVQTDTDARRFVEATRTTAERIAAELRREPVSRLSAEHHDRIEQAITSARASSLPFFVRFRAPLAMAATVAALAGITAVLWQQDVLTTDGPGSNLSQQPTKNAPVERSESALSTEKKSAAADDAAFRQSGKAKQDMADAGANSRELAGWGDAVGAEGPRSDAAPNAPIVTSRSQGGGEDAHADDIAEDHRRAMDKAWAGATSGGLRDGAALKPGAEAPGAGGYLGRAADAKDAPVDGAPESRPAPATAPAPDPSAVAPTAPPAEREARALTERLDHLKAAEELTRRKRESESKTRANLAGAKEMAEANAPQAQSGRRGEVAKKLDSQVRSQLEATIDAEDGERLAQEVDRLAPEVAGEQFAEVVPNPFVRAATESTSTFSIDVDTASYANVRRYLESGQMPPHGAVRIEEMINYFSYYYGETKGDEPFAVNVELATAPWKPAHRLMRIGLQAPRVDADARPPSNLVFLLDVSGSMRDANKLPLVREAMKLLVDELADKDRVAIVTYAGSDKVALQSTPASNKDAIRAAIDDLRSGGSTAGSKGIVRAYEIAQQHFIDGGINRVILATDGDFNVGITDNAALVKLIEEKRRSGVLLSVFGVGTGNLKDAKMEQLADKGNGAYAYLDSLTEARKNLVDGLGGTLHTVAKDVKIQVVFDPQQVAAYRLIGYENRMLANEDFADDTKDAGEVGAGHTVTALYEIVPPGQPTPGLAIAHAEAEGLDGDKGRHAEKAPESSDLALRGTAPAAPRATIEDADEAFEREAAPAGVIADRLPRAAPADAERPLATLKLRYKQPHEDESALLVYPVRDLGRGYADATAEYKWAASVAQFGMILRDEPFRGGANYDAVIELGGEAIANAPQQLSRAELHYRTQMIDLARRAQQIDAQSK